MGIVVRGLTKRYGGKTIVDSVSIDIADGELVSLLGPSGEAEFIFGASGAYPVFVAGRWWTASP